MGSFSENSSEKNKLIIGILAGLSSNDALSSPARTKRLLRRLPQGQLLNQKKALLLSNVAYSHCFPGVDVLHM
jgi:hypothetical protein